MVLLQKIFKHEMSGDEAVNKKVLHLRLKHLIDYAVPTCILSPLYGSALAYVLWNEENQLFLAIWVSLLIISSFVWYLLAISFTKKKVTNPQFIFLGQAFSLIGGLIWGLVGIIPVIASNSVDFLYIAVILIAINIVPQISVSPIPSFHRFFTIACILPYALNPIFYGVTEMYWLTFITLWEIVALLIYGQLYCNTLIKTYQLSVENEQLSKRLKNEKEEIERVSAAKTRFLAAASHDLRQPLQAQHFFVEALKIAKTKKQQDKLIANIQGSTVVLGNLLNSLLDISKLDADIVPTKITSVNLNAILNRINEEFQPIAKKQNIKLLILKTDLWTTSDEVLLENIIRNLVGNSLKYSFKGHVLVACSKTHNDEFTLEVRDTGIGIDAKKMPYIFDEFYQVDNDERDRNKGLGLGLSIVSRLCKLLGLSILVDTKRKIGSRFYLSLKTTTPPELPIEQTNIVLEPLKGKKILIIDDDLLILESLTNLLDQWHCIVISAYSGKDAKDKLSNTLPNELPDAIICDYRLKDNELGSDAIKTVRTALNFDVPAMLLTGETAPERLIALDDTQFIVLHKPIHPAQLRTALSSILFTEDEQ